MAATLPATSIHDRAMTDLAGILAALNLKGKSDGGGTIVGDIGQSVYVQMLPDETNIKFPCILLTVEDEPEEEDEEAMTFEGDAIIYPVRLLICDRVDAARYQKARPTYQLWRYIITQTLLGLPAGPFPFLPNTPECWDLKTRRLKVFDARLPQYQFMVSGMVVSCRTTTARWRGGNPQV